METNAKVKTLITGVGGLVAAHVLRYFLENTDHEIICIDSWEHKGQPANTLKSIKGFEDRVTVITHDLNAPFTDRQKKQIGYVDYILNIASESHVDRSITDPVNFIKNNVNLALNMLEFAREVKPKLFLQFSTDEVYGVAKEGFNHKEWCEHLPSNPYAASKAAQEDIAISYWRTYGVPVMITNTMNIYSETQDWEKFIPLCVKKILRGEKITIHAYPGATKAGSRFYIHADSLAEAVLFLTKTSLAKYPEDDRPDRYNIVGDVEVDNLTLAKTIANILGKDLDYELVDFHSSRPGHDSRYGLDGTKLANLGWKPTMLFKDKIEETVLKLKERYEKEN